MKVSTLVAPLCLGVVLLGGCTNTTEPASGAADSDSSSPATVEAGGHSHGHGPNGGVVFDLGGDHAEFTVDHAKTECQILILDGSNAPKPVAAEEFVLSIQETKTADGTAVPPLTITLRPVDPVDGKASQFVGTDPGLGNVADFKGAVSGQIDGKPALGEFQE